MIESHPCFRQPKNIDQKIWRYLNFSEYADTLLTSSLYFSCPEKYEDIFEGAAPHLTAQNRNKYLSNVNNATGMNFIHTNEQWEDNYLKHRGEYAINCWHLNEYESAAMWKLYSKSNNGIAIQSTYAKLESVLNQNKYLFNLGLVNYIDYQVDTFDWHNGFNFYMHKRKSFIHENEVRAIFWNQSPNNKIDLNNSGAKFNLNIKSLIENIYVSPGSPRWFTELVRNITKTIGYNFSITDSSLDDRPIY